MLRRSILSSVPRQRAKVPSFMCSWDQQLTDSDLLPDLELAASGANTILNTALGSDDDSDDQDFGEGASGDDEEDGQDVARPSRAAPQVTTLGSADDVSVVLTCLPASFGGWECKPSSLRCEPAPGLAVECLTLD